MRYAASASSAPHARAPIGPAEPPRPSTIRPPSTASAALNPPPSSSSTNARLLVGDPEALGLVDDPERGARDLVGRPEVDAVPLAMVRDGGEVDRARAEDERDAGGDQRPHDRAHARDPGARRRLVGALEHHQRELALADRPRPGRAAGRTRPGRARGRTAPWATQRVDERRRVGAERRGREARPRAAAGRRPARRARRRPCRGRCRRRAGRSPESSAPRSFAPSSLAIS